MAMYNPPHPSALKLATALMRTTWKKACGTKFKFTRKLPLTLKPMDDADKSSHIGIALPTKN